MHWLYYAHRSSVVMPKIVIRKLNGAPRLLWREPDMLKSKDYNLTGLISGCHDSPTRLIFVVCVRIDGSSFINLVALKEIKLAHMRWD